MKKKLRNLKLRLFFVENILTFSERRLTEALLWLTKTPSSMWHHIAAHVKNMMFSVKKTIRRKTRKPLYPEATQQPQKLNYKLLEYSIRLIESTSTKAVERATSNAEITGWPECCEENGGIKASPVD